MLKIKLKLHLISDQKLTESDFDLWVCSKFVKK